MKEEERKTKNKNQNQSTTTEQKLTLVTYYSGVGFNILKGEKNGFRTLICKKKNVNFLKFQVYEGKTYHIRLDCTRLAVF